jgi:hypothetical protein
MPLTEHSGAQRRFPSWHVCLCFLLGVLFLYNPFFTIYASSPVLKVQHPLSYRGTVASSELRRSRVTEVQPKVFALVQAVLEAIVPFPRLTALNGVLQHEPLDFQPQTISESLWFRPPPISYLVPSIL